MFLLNVQFTYAWPSKERDSCVERCWYCWREKNAHDWRCSRYKTAHTTARKSLKTDVIVKFGTISLWSHRGSEALGDSSMTVAVEIAN